VPARLQLAPQLPASWEWLRIRNLRWHGVTADVAIRRDASGLSIQVTPRGGALPIELHAVLPPGARQVTRDLLWRPAGGGTGPTGSLRLARVETVTAPATFTLRATPGIRVVPLHAPLELGDVSSRLRVIDATLDGSTFTLRVEGRRGRSYRVRLVGAAVGAVAGASRIDEPTRPEGTLLRIDMPPADPAAASAVLTRTDWAKAEVTVQVGPLR
jgi:hypothetical protein